MDAINEKDLATILRISGVSREAYEQQARVLASRKPGDGGEKFLRLTGVTQAPSTVAVQHVHLARERTVHHGRATPIVLERRLPK